MYALTGLSVDGESLSELEPCGVLEEDVNLSRDLGVKFTTTFVFSTSILLFSVDDEKVGSDDGTANGCGGPSLYENIYNYIM